MFLLEMLIVPELITQCNPGDNHTSDFIGVFFPFPVFKALKKENQPNAHLDIFSDVEILWLKDVYTRHKKMNQSGPNFAYYINLHSSAEMSQTVS